MDRVEEASRLHRDELVYRFMGWKTYKNPHRHSLQSKQSEMFLSSSCLDWQDRLKIQLLLNKIDAKKPRSLTVLHQLMFAFRCECTRPAGQIQLDYG